MSRPAVEFSDYVGADRSLFSLLANGDLRLIASERLRSRLADYYRLTATGTRATLLRHEPVCRYQVCGITPWALQQCICDKCSCATGSPR